MPRQVAQNSAPLVITRTFSTYHAPSPVHIRAHPNSLVECVNIKIWHLWLMLMSESVLFRPLSILTSYGLNEIPFVFWEGNWLITRDATNSIKFELLGVAG
jgi:hypothetical protein